MIKQSFKLFKLAAKNAQGVKVNLLWVLLLEAISIACLFYLNKQYGLIYQGIQDYNIPMIYQGLIWFSGIAGFLVLVGGIFTFYVNRLSFSIREGLTTYYVQRIEKYDHIENLPQRIQEDLRNFGEKSCEFWLAVLSSLIKLPLFLGVIISLTQWWVGAIVLTIVVIGTVLTKLLANKLISLQVIQESNEANLRETVKAKGSILQSYLLVKNKFKKINLQVKKLSFLQGGLGQTFVLLPFIILLPLYIAKSITMGAFMQSVNALSKVISSLTVLIDNRQLIVSINTCLKRMETLD